jgi:16S rRNA (guanine1516-N2)-methyltransferase
MNIISTVPFFTEDEKREEEGLALTKKYKLLQVANFYHDRMMLVLSKERLELRLPVKNTKPICVDFLTKRFIERLSKNRGRHELIARAVGIKGRYFPSIIDATAGLGVDSALLAHLGCHVQMVERSPVMCALLEDGLKRGIAEGLDWL